MKCATTRKSARAFLPTLTLALVAGASLAISACDDSTGPDEETLVGSWNVTSFAIPVLGDPIPQGMSLTVTLNGSSTSGTYVIQVQNDLIEICEGETSCSQNGDYTATTSQITLDPNDPESATVFTYTIQGSTMTWVGAIDGTPVTITLERS